MGRARPQDDPRGWRPEDCVRWEKEGREEQRGTNGGGDRGVSNFMQPTHLTGTNLYSPITDKEGQSHNPNMKPETPHPKRHHLRVLKPCSCNHVSHVHATKFHIWLIQHTHLKIVPGAFFLSSFSLAGLLSLSARTNPLLHQLWSTQRTPAYDTLLFHGIVLVTHLSYLMHLSD